MVFTQGRFLTQQCPRHSPLPHTNVNPTTIQLLVYCIVLWSTATTASILQFLRRQFKFERNRNSYSWMIVYYLPSGEKLIGKIDRQLTTNLAIIISNVNTIKIIYCKSCSFLQSAGKTMNP